MKKLLLAFALLLSSFAAFAQDQHLPTRSVFAELGGSGLAYSFNYDFRFDSTRMDSWGMRVGAGGYKIGGDSFFSLPVLVNRLFGKGDRFFELGLGMTFFGVNNEPYSYCQSFDSNGNCIGPLVTEESDVNFILPVDGSPSLMGTMNIGYRKIPVFNNNGFWPLFAGIGLGYAF
jgi:hypothetical protein